MTTVSVLRFASVMLTAIGMSAGLAHLFALPNKMNFLALVLLTLSLPARRAE